MNRAKKISSTDPEKGFTLIEILIGMVVALIVLGVVISIFIIQTRHFSAQDQILEMNEYARAGMQMMVSDLLMAGYNPTKSLSNVGIESADSNSIEFTADINESGTTEDTDPPEPIDSNEHVTYAYDAMDKQVTRKSTASDSAKPIIENADSLVFTYYDSSNNELTAPVTDTSKIRKIRIQLTIKTKQGNRTQTLTSNVVPRNIGL